MLKWAALLVAASLSIPAIGQEFTIDMSMPELAEARSRLTISDLAVGETGIITGLNLCNNNGEILLYGMAPIADGPSEYIDNYYIKRLPDHRVEVTSRMGEKSSANLFDLLASTLMSALDRECRLDVLPRSYYFTVTTIDGEVSASNLLRKHE